MLDILSKKHVEEKVIALLEHANTFLQKLGGKVGYLILVICPKNNHIVEVVCLLYVQLFKHYNIVLIILYHN